MAEERFISFQFCDDVRQEVGNKYSLIGCYGPSMLINTFPATLPKLCAQVKVHASIDAPLQELSIRILCNDQTTAEVVVPRESLVCATELPSWFRYQMFTALLVMTPFQVEAPCLLRVEADTERGVLNGGTFQIELAR